MATPENTSLKNNSLSEIKDNGPVIIYFLEQSSAQELRPKPCPAPLAVRECVRKQWPLNRFLYQWVGGPWRWFDKLSWSDEAWREYVENPELRTWVAYVEGSPVGYYELQRQPNGQVEIMYFGLAPDAVGAGYGGYLLSHALQSAWAWPATKVCVNTCSLDHPAALANYLARGMQLVRQLEKP